MNIEQEEILNRSGCLVFEIALYAIKIILYDTLNCMNVYLTAEVSFHIDTQVYLCLLYHRDNCNVWAEIDTVKFIFILSRAEGHAQRGAGLNFRPLGFRWGPRSS